MGGETYTVGELLFGVRSALTDRFGGPVWVSGEIAAIKRGRNGHVWFDLVERDDTGTVKAALPVVLWSSVRDGVNAQLRRAGSIRMADGVRIRISGPLDLYAPAGRIQLQMQGIDPAYTLGLLATERDRVLRLLEAEGLVDRNGSLTAPPAPTHVGLVTAAGSAAEADFLQTLVESGLEWRVTIIDARVQGAGAARAVAAGLLAAEEAGAEVVALVRGGGARTDLATFDSELIARTIAALGVPVLTGIGHEIDSSVADVVAHGAHKTPTACAAALVLAASAVVRQAEAAWEAIVATARHRVDEAGERSAALAHRAARAVQARVVVEGHRTDHAALRLRSAAASVPAQASAGVERTAGRVEGSGRAHLRAHSRQLDAQVIQVGTGARRAVRTATTALDAVEARVAALDPARALARGWTITRTATGTVVRRTHDVAPGDVLVTTVADGTVTSTVADAPREEPDDVR